MSAIKVCGCGRRYSVEEWKKLKLVYDGHLDEENASSGIELRDCVCTSTIDLLVPGTPIEQSSTGRTGTIAPWLADEWSERGYTRVLWNSDRRWHGNWRGEHKEPAIGALVDVTSVVVMSG